MITRISNSQLFLRPVTAIVGISLFASVLAYLGPFHWFWDLVNQFRLQIILLSGFMTLALTGFVRENGKLRIGIFVSILCLILNIVPIAALFVSGKVQCVNSRTGSAQFSVLQYNVLSSNPYREQFLAYVRKRSPDFLCIEEIGPEWQAALETLKDLYPAQYIVPRIDNFGIAFLSKRPLKSCEVLDLSGSSVPTLQAKVLVDKKMLTIVATHTIPPVNPQCGDWRNEQLVKLAELASNLPGDESFILCGDFNAVSWSLPDSFFSSMREITSNYLIQQTWPTMLPGFLRIAIDHVFCSSKLAPVYQTSSDVCGSDHLGILTGFSFKEEN